MKVAVASGKGGTGKTTVAVNLALAVDDAQLFDCDVEEPDCHLFLDGDVTTIEEITAFEPTIDPDRCDLCGECADHCRYSAIVMTPEEPMLFPELCRSCGLCSLTCPNDAISEESKPIGNVERGYHRSGSKSSESDAVPLYSGILATGELLVPPVIEAVQSHVDPDRPAIIDAPPGNACAAMESIEGSDYCILVTEPTPFGLHDLELSVEMLRKMDVPFGVVVNRADLGDNRVEEFCDEEGIPILMTIPDDRRIAELYSDGTPFVTEMPEWEREFSDLYGTIRELIS